MFGLRAVRPSWFLTALVWVLMSRVGLAQTIVPFNGKSLDGWTAREPRDRSKWTVGQAQLDPRDPARLEVSAAGQGAGQLINAAASKYAAKELKGVDFYTVQEFGDCTIRLEFMIPQGSNSGVYVMGEYEVQIKDAWGLKSLTFQDLGAIYKVVPARVNAARQPGQWQTLLIEFRAPKFQNGVKTVNARFVKVALNDQLIHENVEPSNVTPGGLTGKEVPVGPLMFQGDHGPVAYRNIQITLPQPSCGSTGR